MKKIFLIFKLFSFILFDTYCQVETKIYIILDSTSKVEIIESRNDSLTIELYRFNLEDNIKDLHFSLDPDGVLKKHISTVGTINNRKLEFRYENLNKLNKPVLIGDLELKNSITYEELKRIKDFDSLIELFDNVDEIYIVFGEDCVYKDYYYIAKKVSFEDIKSGL